jgi:putative cobalt transporter subunit CbtB
MGDFRGAYSSAGDLFCGGATSLISGTSVHEFVHDGRHLLGFPCH